jgi:hypothetical protein
VVFGGLDFRFPSGIMPGGNTNKRGTTMVIHIDPDLAAALGTLARQQGVAPEVLAANVLRERLLAPAVKIQPRDEWERGLLAAATDCGVSLSNEAVSSEGLYD